MFFKKRSTTPVARTRAPQSTPRGPIFSYHANRSVRIGSMARNADEPQLDATSRPQPKHEWIKRLPSMAAMLVVLAIAVLCLQLGNNPKVVTVKAGENQVFLRDRKVYTDAAHAAFTPLFNSNKLTVNASKISADLQKQFPELKAVSVTLPIVGSQPVVYIQPATPKLLLVAKNGMYLLDNDGRALISGTQVPDLESLHVPIVNDQGGLSIELGHIALPRSTVSFITEVMGQLQAKGVTTTNLTLMTGSTELQAHIAGVGYYVRFNLHGKAREETGAFLTAKQYLEASHKTPAEYVDVRVENKAYFK
jgi:hypothetical protein